MASSSKKMKFEPASVRAALISGTVTIIAAALGGILTFFGTGVVNKKESVVSISQIHAPFLSALKDSSLDQKNAELLYEATTGINRENPNFTNNLRDALVELNLLLTKNELPDSIISRVRMNWAEQVRELIKELEEVSPYQALPTVERRIFNELNDKLESTSVKENINELAALVLARAEELEETRTQARWSLIFAIAGLVGTVVSITISVFQMRQRINLEVDDPEISDG